MADFVGRTLAIATGGAVVHAVLGNSSWWIVLALAMVTVTWTVGTVLYHDAVRAEDS